MEYGDDSAYIVKVGGALSQLVNVAILSLFWGHRHTSASARAWLAASATAEIIDTGV